MSPEAFDALASRCERWNTRAPRLYRSSVIAIALLGYLYLALLLVGSLLVLTLACIGFYYAPRVAKLWIIMIISSVVVLWQILRAVWVRFPQPEGITLTRDNAPHLLDAVEEIRLVIGAPRIHRILVSGELNAFITQVPRLGVLPLSRNFLVLGMPLLRSLTQDQARAVIAHELGHLAGAHGRISSWIYRIRSTWGSIAQRLDSHSWLISRFLRWYVPFVNAYSFTLARTNEYQADEASARVAGVTASGSALIRVSIVANHSSQRFWPEFQRSLLSAERPPAGFLNPLRTALVSASAVDVLRWTKESWLQPTDRSDTHPCLRERLTHIGMPNLSNSPPDPPAAPAAGHDAAELWLGHEAVVLESLLDRSWSQSVSLGWAEAHAEFVSARKKREALMQEISAGKTDAGRLWEFARLTRDTEGQEAAIPALRALLEVAPEHALGCFSLGCSLLDRDDEHGVELLEQAMRSEPSATLTIQARLKHFHSSHGQLDKLKLVEQQAWQRSEVERMAAEERSRLPGKSTPLMPHGLTAEEVASVVKVLSGEREVQSAVAVTVATNHLPEIPYRLLCIRRTSSWWKPRSSTADDKLLQRLATSITLSGNYMVFIGSGEQAKLAKRARKVVDSTVYTRI